LGFTGVKNKLFTIFNDIAHVLKPVEVGPYPAPPPDIQTPEDWEPHTQLYIHNGKTQTADITYSPARAEHAKGDIFYTLGWKAHPLEKRDVILDFQNRGYNVITMPLVEANGSIGTMAENITRMKRTLFNKSSVLHDLHDENHPLFVVSHSTSATVYETALQESKIDELYRPDIELVIPTNPFINARGSSRSEDPIISRLYRWHAKRHMDDHAGSPLADRLYYLACGLVDNLKFEDPRGRPTHGQILEISKYGDSLLESYNIGEASDSPVIAFISEDDDFASAAVAKRYYNSKLTLKGMRSVEAEHNVLLNTELRSEILDILDEHSAHFKPKHSPSHATEQEEEPPEAFIFA